MLCWRKSTFPDEKNLNLAFDCEGHERREACSSLKWWRPENGYDLGRVGRRCEGCGFGGVLTACGPW